MCKMRVALLLLVVAGGTAWAADQFDGIKCGTDIPKALIGKKSPNGPSADVEQRHKDLSLKNLGGSELSGRLSLESWQVCGSEYQLLVNTKTGLIRDAIQFPAHSKASPEFTGACQVLGKKVPGTMVAVLDNSKHYDARDEKLANTMLKATAAWKVDEKTEKFAKQPTDNLTCPLDGIITADGGP